MLAPHDGHTLKSVTIVTLPAAAQGTLKVGTAAATLAQVVAAADLGTLSFEPASSFTGRATFTYKVTDSSDTESSAAGTVAVTVGAPDRALLTLETAALVSNTGQGASNADAGNFTRDYAQSFTTASVAGGYTLTGVDLFMRSTGAGDEPSYDVKVPPMACGARGPAKPIGRFRATPVWR